MITNCIQDTFKCLFLKKYDLFSFKSCHLLNSIDLPDGNDLISNKTDGNGCDFGSANLLYKNDDD